MYPIECRWLTPKEPHVTEVVKITLIGVLLGVTAFALSLATLAALATLMRMS